MLTLECRCGARFEAETGTEAGMTALSTQWLSAHPHAHVFTRDQAMTPREEA